MTSETYMFEPEIEAMPRDQLEALQLEKLQKIVRQVPVTDHVVDYALALVRQTRIGEDGIPDFVDKWLSWGAGPRGVLTLVSAAKARAILHGRYHATAGDIQAVAKPALRHRVAVNYAAQAADINSEKLLIKSPAWGPTTVAPRTWRCPALQWTITNPC